MLSVAPPEFAHLVAERNRRKRRKSVTIRIAPDVLVNHKIMGDGYTSDMADVLKYAVGKFERYSKGHKLNRPV